MDILLAFLYYPLVQFIAWLVSDRRRAKTDEAYCKHIDRVVWRWLVVGIVFFGGLHLYLHLNNSY